MACCRQQPLKGNNSGSCKVSKKLGAIQLNERNVFEMMEYRSDAGFSALSQNEAYWEALRG